MPESTPLAPVIPGSFVHDGVGFVCNDTHVSDHLPGAVRQKYEDFDATLKASGRLPRLGKAPISAWMLARLAALCGRRFPYEDGEECGSDGDDYFVSLIAFAAGATIRPIGCVSVFGGRENVTVDVEAAPPHSVQQLHDSFLGALLSDPKDVGIIRIVIVYTSLEDPDHWKHVPYTLGWDGSKYLFHDSPEYTISAEDYE